MGLIGSRFLGDSRSATWPVPAEAPEPRFRGRSSRVVALVTTLGCRRPSKLPLTIFLSFFFFFEAAVESAWPSFLARNQIVGA